MTNDDVNANDQNDDLIGTTLGQFTILEEIGRGGMATVYRARQQSMNRIVAVKVLPRHLLHDPGFFERFEREVDVIAHLEHPHILPIYEYGGKAEGQPYIAMRYLAGGSLEQSIRRELLPLPDLERPLRQVALALDHAHQQGIIHRDLKPGNIMLDEAGNAYLSDFGIARVLGSDLTGSMIIGTPSYMSPEQANGLPIDGRSDIYALGVVLFELITGRLPYQAETPMAVLLKHINEPMPPVADFRSGVSGAIESVVRKATAKDPDDRFSSASDMAAAFSRALHGNQTPTYDRPTRPSDDETELDAQPTMPPLRTPTPLPASQTGEEVQQETVARRAPVGLIVGGVVIAALVVAALIIALPLLNQGDDPVVTPSVVDAIPTPFFRAQTIDETLYTISIPSAWVPSGDQPYTDLSDLNRQIHVWQDDLNAYVAVELTDAQLNNEAAFQEAVEDYTAQYIENRGFLTFIDEAVAPNGTVRRSYRMVGAEDPAFPPGQLDVFFFNQSPYLVAVNMYSADETGNTLVDTFQQVLDSLRVKRNVEVAG